MFLVMRWQIEPTQENYDRLPHWVTPRPSQLFTAHALWIDHLPWYVPIAALNCLEREYG